MWPRAWFVASARDVAVEQVVRVRDVVNPEGRWERGENKLVVVASSADLWAKWRMSKAERSVREVIKAA